MLRWLSVLVVAAVISLAAGDAGAQVFRPRGARGAVIAKAAPATPAAGKKAPAAEPSTSKAPARAAAAPKRTKKHKARPRDDSDDVKVDDDEDVTITDD